MLFGSISSLTATAVAFLPFLATTFAQGNCGGIVQNSLLETYSVIYTTNFTILTINGLNNNHNHESYVLYCGDTIPDGIALMTYGLGPDSVKIKVPLTYVIVSDTHASSYIEISGHGDSIAFLHEPERIVSPCLQKRFQDKTLLPFDNSEFQWNTVNAGILENMYSARSKAIWIPASIEVDPLLRIEYITVVSMFYNDGEHGQLLYNEIKSAYTNLKADMAQIPPENKKRIAWVKYDFTLGTWKLRNSAFTRGIIEAAGGISFPLNGDGVPDDYSISSDEIKTLLLNAQIVIDQTNFTGQDGSVQQWRTLAGFSSSQELPVLASWNVYTLDNTVNENGDSDYDYRLASRPDILLKDLIYVQYPQYNPNYSTTFLNLNFAKNDGKPNVLKATDCGLVKYNSGDIPVIVRNPTFTGDATPPPAPTGGGIYGSGNDDGSKAEGGGSKTGIIVAVICVVVILGAGFAFVFFKWGKRAKEDRFIELEEEMNNDIPLH
ncbi:hypothetical protein BGX27_003272 [Mortierella sp. AM989]|nr:hypothetical protein BGX27_003272 [Mortierella sp. AM989]